MSQTRLVQCINAFHQLLQVVSADLLAESIMIHEAIQETAALHILHQDVGNFGAACLIFILENCVLLRAVILDEVRVFFQFTCFYLIIEHLEVLLLPYLGGIGLAIGPILDCIDFAKGAFSQLLHHCVFAVQKAINDDCLFAF